ncbi:MAG: substrate-binding domain-containing protein [Phycisphaerales bacterium]
MNSVLYALTVAGALLGAATPPATQTAPVAPAATTIPATPLVPAQSVAPAATVTHAAKTIPSTTAGPEHVIPPEPVIMNEEIAKIIYDFPDYVPVPSWKGSITIQGSDTMASTLTGLAEAFNRLYPDVKFNIRGGGSVQALADLVAGTCDFASVSRNLTDAEVAQIKKDSGADVVEIKIASGGACVIVNADNPITKITREQLNGIFAITHSMTKDPIFAWKELDPTSPIGQEWIALYVTDENSSTMKTFTDFAMPNERFTTSYFYREPSPSSVVNACCAYKTAIGIGSFKHMQPRAKTLAVSADNGKTFVAPTEMNIYTGEYPMARPLELVAVLDKQGNLPPLLLDFVRFILSETGQDEIHDEGYAPANPKQLPAFIVRANAAAAAAAPHALPKSSPGAEPNTNPSVAP